MVSRGPRARASVIYRRCRHGAECGHCYILDGHPAPPKSAAQTVKTHITPDTFAGDSRATYGGAPPSAPSGGTGRAGPCPAAALVSGLPAATAVRPSAWRRPPFPMDARPSGAAPFHRTDRRFSEQGPKPAGRPRDRPPAVRCAGPSRHAPGERPGVPAKAAPAAARPYTPRRRAPAPVPGDAARRGPCYHVCILALRAPPRTAARGWRRPRAPSRRPHSRAARPAVPIWLPAAFSQDLPGPTPVRLFQPGQPRA